MAFVTDSPIEGEEFLDDVGDVRRRENVGDVDGVCFGVEEVCPGVVAGDVNVAVGVGDKAAGEGGEERESGGEGLFEEREKGSEGERRASEEAAFLDVMAGEHREVRDGELEVVHGGWLGGENGGFGDDSDEWCRGMFRG